MKRAAFSGFNARLSIGAAGGTGNDPQLANCKLLLQHRDLSGTCCLQGNLNDLVDKAEDPEKMIKQVILDMQNQLLQVKTQVAIAIADQHCN